MFKTVYFQLEPNTHYGIVIGLREPDSQTETSIRGAVNDAMGAVIGDFERYAGEPLGISFEVAVMKTPSSLSPGETGTPEFQGHLYYMVFVINETPEGGELPSPEEWREEYDSLSRVLGKGKGLVLLYNGSVMVSRERGSGPLFLSSLAF